MTERGGGRTTVDVVIPCYNEVSVLRESVERTLALFEEHPGYDWRLVIADNGSNDGTSELARELDAEHTRVQALVLTIKGRGIALREAWLGSKADVVSYMDVDLSTDLTHLPELVGMVAEGGYDVVKPPPHGSPQASTPRPSPASRDPPGDGRSGRRSAPARRPPTNERPYPSSGRGGFQGPAASRHGGA